MSNASLPRTGGSIMETNNRAWSHEDLSHECSNQDARTRYSELRMDDSAAALVQLDVSVIRLHGIVDGRCTCSRRGCKSPGKHPDVGPSWKRFRRERADLGLVRQWFTQKPI